MIGERHEQELVRDEEAVAGDDLKTSQLPGGDIFQMLFAGAKG